MTAATPEFIELQRQQARLADLGLQLAQMYAKRDISHVRYELWAHEKQYHDGTFHESDASGSIAKQGLKIKAKLVQYDEVRKDVSRLIDEVSRQ